MIEATTRSADLLRRCDDPWTLADALKFKILGHQMVGDIAAVHAVRDELEPLAKRVGNVWALMEVVRAVSVTELMVTGDLDGWDAQWKMDIELNEQHGSRWTEHSYLGFGRSEFWRGNWDAAIVQLKKAIAIENPGKYYGSPRAALFLTQCYANPGDAMRVLNDGFESVERIGAVRSAGDWWAMVLIAEGLAVLGEIELLTKLYPRIREAARTEWVTAFAGFQQFKKAAAIAAAAVGEHDEAEAFFRAALEEADRLPIKLEQPEVRRWYAKMLVERNESGDRARAHELLGEARDAYRTIGMPRHLDMANELLKD